MRRPAWGWCAFALVAVGLFALPVQAQDPELRKRVVGVMGTELQVTVIGTNAAALEGAMDLAIAEMRRVEDLMTDWRASPLEDLNKAAGAGPQSLPRELVTLISRAKALQRLTDGAFDISFASVGKLWDYKKKPPQVPDEAAIASQLAYVDASRIVVDPASNSVALPAGMRIGLGGIAKGYGVDCAMQVLRDQGIAHAMVNAGGDLKVLGRKFGEPWEVAIKHPRDRERVVAVLKLANTCVVTSGDYERFFDKDGKRYHHILDPRTGYPATGCMSATVVAPNAELADALATALCVLDPDRGLALAEGLPRVEALLVTMDGEVRVTSGLEDSLLPEAPPAGSLRP